VQSQFSVTCSLSSSVAVLALNIKSCTPQGYAVVLPMRHKVAEAGIFQKQVESGLRDGSPPVGSRGKALVQGGSMESTMLHYCRYFNVLQYKSSGFNKGARGN